jgi:glycosyltransferase involved in cell wall biosynthesis
MLRSIGKKLAEEGHEVVVLSSQPDYKTSVVTKRQPSVENLDGMVVHRFFLFRERKRNVIFRLINMLYFPLRIVLFSIFGGKFDIIMVSTAPPVVAGLAAALGAKLVGAEFFYHCMDIHPEIGRISGEFRNTIVYSLLMTLDKVSCGIAKYVIVLSEDMRRSLLARSNYDPNNIRVINNFSMPYYGESLAVSPELLKHKNRFRIIFTGNIGRFQGLEVFVDAMKKLAHRPMIEMVFVGEGTAMSELKKRALGLENVMFLPHQSVDIARKLIADADLGAVSLAKGIYQFAYPSKTMTYLDVGCPLLVVVENSSGLARFIESAHIGVIAEPSQPQSVANAIESVYVNRIQYCEMKIAAKKIGKAMFSEAIVIKQWLSLFHSIGTN